MATRLSGGNREKNQLGSWASFNSLFHSGALFGRLERQSHLSGYLAYFRVVAWQYLYPSLSLSLYLSIALTLVWPVKVSEATSRSRAKNKVVQVGARQESWAIEVEAGEGRLKDRSKWREGKKRVEKRRESLLEHAHFSAGTILELDLTSKFMQPILAQAGFSFSFQTFVSPIKL